jgi:FixJ family two-component response regulator
MTGLELQRRLRNEHRCLPIIFMSAYDEPSVREQALQGGAISFLLKPFMGEALFNALKSVSETSGDGMNSQGDEEPFAEQVGMTAQGGHHASRKGERSKSPW